MDIEETRVVSMKSLVPKHHVGKGEYEYRKYVAVDRHAENRCTVAFYELPPGKANYPLHYHERADEVFYIISGTGLLTTPAGKKTVEPGDLVICPPSEKGAHRLTNLSATESLVYLDFDAVGLPDVVMYPESGKVGVLVDGQPNRFFRLDSAVDYYDGE